MELDLFPKYRTMHIVPEDVQITSGSAFIRGQHIGWDIPLYSPFGRVRVCAYCREQKESLSCPGCGARRDLEWVML